MNNGQTQIPQGQPGQPEFFTAGVGNRNPAENPDPFNLNNNEFTDPHEIAKKIATKSNLGNTALSSPSAEPNQSINKPGLELVERNIPDIAPPIPPDNDLPFPGTMSPNLNKPNSLDDTDDTDNDKPELGQIIDINNPPLKDDTKPQKSTEEARSKELENHFKDAEIDKDDLKYIKSAEDELTQDGDIAKFYSFWEDAKNEARENAKKGTG